MKLELGIQTVINTFTNAKCPDPECKGKLAVSYGWPMAIATLHIYCSSCGTVVDPNSVRVEFDTLKKEGHN